MKLRYTNSRGETVCKTVVAEFHDTDGHRFFVVPRARGTYDFDPPYAIIQYNFEEMEIIHD